MENTNTFDLIIIILIFFLGLKGLIRGFIREFFGILGIIGGVYIASRLSDDVGLFISKMFAIKSESTYILIGFMLTLVLFWIIAYLIGVGVSKATELSGLGIMDRILGFIFGAGKIFLIFAVITYALSTVDTIAAKIKAKTKNSIMYPILRDSGKYIVKLDTTKLTKNVKKEYEGVVFKTKETLKDAAKSEVGQRIKALGDSDDSEKDKETNNAK